MAKILVVDDDAAVRSLAVRAIVRFGHRPFAAESGEAAVALAHAIRPDVAVVDLRLPGIDGLETGRRLRAEHPGLVVVMISGYPVDSPTTTVLRTELFDFQAKPFHWTELLTRTLPPMGTEVSAPRAAVVTAPQTPRDDLYPEFLGESSAMRHVIRLMSRVAPMSECVLVLGETGTGKELVAR